jgi:hypothetical protein
MRGAAIALGALAALWLFANFLLTVVHLGRYLREECGGQTPPSQPPGGDKP